MGVDAYSWYNSGDACGQEFSLAVEDLRNERIFVSPFMSNPHESRYGDYGFVVGFKDLLKSYKQSRADIMDTADQAVCLLVGGTLRYRYEICYVVIVCTKHDQELQCYPSLYTQSDIFDHKGLVLLSGEVN